jgi:hypothetical protein
MSDRLDVYFKHLEASMRGTSVYTYQRLIAAFSAWCDAEELNLFDLETSDLERFVTLLVAGMAGHRECPLDYLLTGSFTKAYSVQEIRSSRDDS